MSKLPPTHRLFSLLHKVIFTADRRANALFAEADIKSGFSESLVLHTLHHNKESSQHNIATCLNLTPAAVSRRIDTLVKRGLAKREEDEESRRTNRIVLTPKGTDEFEHIDKILKHGFEKPVAVLTDKEVEQTCQILEKLLASLTTK